jgi:hypothetical protein
MLVDQENKYFLIDLPFSALSEITKELLAKYIALLMLKISSTIEGINILEAQR